MTIAIKITNEDSRENAIVDVKVLRRAPNSVVEISRSHLHHLKGGDSVSEFVFDGQSIVLEEHQNG